VTYYKGIPQGPDLFPSPITTGSRWYI